MAKKKRRLGRRPRPDTRGGGKTTSTSTAGTPVVEEEMDASDEGAAVDVEERPQGTEDAEGPSTADEEHDPSSRHDEATEDAATEDAATEDEASEDEASEDEASEDEATDGGLAGDDLSPQELDGAVSDGAEDEDVVEGDDTASPSDFEAEDGQSGMSVQQNADFPGEEGLRREGVDAESQDEIPPSSEGPHLVGEGVEIDESQVDDTEGYLKGLVEAVIFSSDRPQTAKEVARAAKIDKRRAQELIELLMDDTRDRGVRLVAVADGYAYRTNPAYSSYVREFLAQRPVRLSRAQLETLAIIAYRQPITRPEVDDIRGVDSGAVVKTLLERDLIRILGKKDEPGRPMLYGTTPQFLDLFSLNSLRDLPTLREFTELSDDSRAKFELEVGEPAPEGPIDFEEELSDGDEDFVVLPDEIPDEEPAVDPQPASGEEETEEEKADQAEIEADELEEFETGATKETTSDDEDELDPESTRDAVDPEEGIDQDSELADEDFDEDSPQQAYVPPAVSPEDEEEFPDDEDDDDDEDEDEDDDDDDDDDDR